MLCFKPRHVNTENHIYFGLSQHYMLDYQEYEFKYTPNDKTPIYIRNFWTSGEALRKREVNTVIDCAVLLFSNHVFARVTEAGDLGYLTMIKRANEPVPSSIAGFLMAPSQKAEFIEMKQSSLHPLQAYARQDCEDANERTFGPLLDFLREEYVRDLELV